MSDGTRHLPWYESTVFLVVALIVCWPVGLALIWVQRAFMQPARIAVSVAAPVLTALAITGIVLIAAQPAATLEPKPASTVSVITTPSAPTTPSVASSSTVTTSTASTSTPKADDSGITKNPGSQGGGASGPKPAPAKPGAKTESTARFTVEGEIAVSTAGQQITVTMKAVQTSGIRTYQWWIQASGNTANVQSSSPSYTYTYYGMPPTSVSLTATDNNGKLHSASAGVTVKNGYIRGATL